MHLSSYSPLTLRTTMSFILEPENDKQFALHKYFLQFLSIYFQKELTYFVDFL